MIDSQGEIQTVRERPEGYLTSQEFADRVGHVSQTIMYAFRRGRFPKDKCLWWDKGGQKALLIHEDRVQYYKANCRASKPGPKSKPKSKPKTSPKPAPAPLSPAPAPQSQTPTEGLERLIDRDPLEISDPDIVKLYKDQIATKRAKLELQKAENQLLDCEEVASLWSGLAVQIRQSILAIVPRLAARLAAESDAHKCRTMLQEEILEALTQLSKFGERYGE